MPTSTATRRSMASSSTLADAMGKLRSQSSSFGSNLSIVQNRTDFTKNMINTLETGAANLTLADTNEEAANLLALQTRQQLVFDGPVDGFAGRPGRAASVRLISIPRSSRYPERRASARRFCIPAVRAHHSVSSRRTGAKTSLTADRSRRTNSNCAERLKAFLRAADNDGATSQEETVVQRVRTQKGT